MARQRDYRAEYARRVARSAERGLSRSQARGHARVGEVPVSAKAATPRYDRRLEEGLKALRAGKTLNAAARSVRVAKDRLRRYVAQNVVAEKQRGRWVITHDPRRRQMPVYSGGHEHSIIVDPEPASQVGAYMSAVGQFLATNDP